jgi:hypothetical protein
MGYIKTTFGGLLLAIPIFGGTIVSGATRFSNSLVTNTISATTYLNLPIFSGSSSPITFRTYTSLFSKGINAGKGSC